MHHADAMQRPKSICTPECRPKISYDLGGRESQFPISFIFVASVCSCAFIIPSSLLHSFISLRQRVAPPSLTAAPAFWVGCERAVPEKDRHPQQTRTLDETKQSPLIRFEVPAHERRLFDLSLLQLHCLCPPISQAEQHNGDQWLRSSQWLRLQTIYSHCRRPWYDDYSKYSTTARSDTALLLIHTLNLRIHRPPPCLSHT